MTTLLKSTLSSLAVGSKLAMLSASSGKRNATVWRPSVCLSVRLSRSTTHRDSPRGHHATRPAYISVRQKGGPTYLLICKTQPWLSIQGRPRTLVQCDTAQVLIYGLSTRTCADKDDVVSSSISSQDTPVNSYRRETRPTDTHFTDTLYSIHTYVGLHIPI